MSKFLENILQSIRTIAGTTDEKILKLENLLAMTPHKERRARGKIETLLEEFRGLRDGGVRYRIWIGRKPDKPSMTILSTRSLRGNPVVKINETFSVVWCLTSVRKNKVLSRTIKRGRI